jgi:hypothetical protein
LTLWASFASFWALWPDVSIASPSETGQIAALHELTKGVYIENSKRYKLSVGVIAIH